MEATPMQVQDGMHMTCPDGEKATILAAGEARWHIEKDNGVTIWGISTLEVQQLLALAAHKAEVVAQLLRDEELLLERQQLIAAAREEDKANKLAAKEAASALRKALNRKAKCI